MRIESGSLWFELPPELVEEVLALAADSAAEQERRAYYEEREAISGIEIIDIRENAFRSFDARWINRFNILEPIRASLSDEVAIDGCSLRRVRTPGEERSFVTVEAGQRILTLDIRVRTLLSRDALQALLRHIE